MTRLWIRIDNADNVTQSRAVNALAHAGIDVQGAWLGQHDPQLVAEVKRSLNIRRDWAGMAMGVIIAAIFGTATYYLWGLGGWWIAAAIPCSLAALLGVFGFFSDAQKKPRKNKKTRNDTDDD